MANDLFFSRDTKLVVSDGTSAWEIPVLDGFSFSQATNSSEVTLQEMEAAGVSRRGRKMFNDSVAPAEWSFSTYARPFKGRVNGDGTPDAPFAGGWDGSDSHMHAVEECLWGALVSKSAYVPGVAGTGNGAWATSIANTAGACTIDFNDSNTATLKELDIFFIMGAGTYSSGTHQVYKLAKAVVNSASIDFDIDGIATINWSGFASTITDQASQPTVTINEGLNGTNNFIRNRLTTLTVTAEALGSIETAYSLTLTGGTISFENNITFLTPETLGTVNSPIGHVTGNRTIGGSFTCYLSNSTAAGADLFEDLAGSTSVITNDFTLVFDIGGVAAGTPIAPHMQVTLPKCHLEIPSHSIEDVISLETTFHALPGSITAADEATIVYKGVTIPL
jgi:hypothetical protein